MNERELLANRMQGAAAQTVQHGFGNSPSKAMQVEQIAQVLIGWTLGVAVVPEVKCFSRYQIAQDDLELLLTFRQNIVTMTADEINGPLMLQNLFGAVRTLLKGYA